jgi:putative sterol carrier protein
MTFQEKHHETILFVRLYKFGGLALDIMLERILSLIPKKENGDFQHGAKKEFAQSIGFKNGNIVSLWISGASKSYKGKLAEISDKYNVSMDWLCGKENAKEPCENRMIRAVKNFSLFILQFRP